jgi:hypothetical protein
VTALQSAALQSIALFQALGIAIFPGRYGQKGTYIKGWPVMPAAEAWEITRQELRKHGRINLAARTGPATDGNFYMVLDTDNTESIARLPLLREAYGDSIVAIVRTGPLHDGRDGRGLHVWVRVPQPVINAKSTAGEVLCVDRNGKGHLANVPPSRHPSGTPYEWISL